MTHEDHVSGEYELVHTIEFYAPYWEPNNTEWIDHRIRKDPEVAEKIAKNAPKKAAKWDFKTIEGLIVCTEGVFIVNYFAFREIPKT